MVLIRRRNCRFKGEALVQLIEGGSFMEQVVQFTEWSKGSGRQGGWIPEAPGKTIQLAFQSRKDCSPFKGGYKFRVVGYYEYEPEPAAALG